MVNVALLQMRPRDNDLEYNRQRAAEMIDEAMSSGNDVDLILLPETWTAPFNPQKDLLKQVETSGETIDGPSLKMLCEQAKKHRIWIVSGSFPVKLDKYADGRYRNTTFLINPEGKVVTDYSKIHLCAWIGEDIPFAYGDEIKSYETDLAKLGLIICYDIRFPELTRRLALSGAQVLTVPAYFSTSVNHWRTLLLARAIENQIFVIACNCSGDQVFGHSMIIDPFGNVIAEAGNQEEILYGSLDLSMIDKVRDEVTYLKDRQPDVYARKVVEPSS